MRVGIFTDQYYPLISGVVTSIKMLKDGLEQLGHQVYIFTSFDEKKATELIPSDVINIPGRSYPFKNLKDYRYTFTHKRFVKIIKKYNLDIIHLQTEFNIAKIAKVAHKKLNIPVVHTMHTLWNDYFKYLSPFFDKHAHNLMNSLLKKMFMKDCAKMSEIQIVPTKKVFEQKDNYALGKEIRIVPTGIELDRFYPNNLDKEKELKIKQSLNIKEGTFVFLYIGRTSEEKNIPTLIKAFARANLDNSVFLIVGGGPELDELKDLAKELKIDNKIIFTGLVEWVNIPYYYQLGDVFLNASQSETQGLTYIEALASGKPLLVQKDECIEDVVVDYYNGLYFDGEDELVQKMKEIVKAPDTLKTIKANTLKSVENYSKEQFTKNILSIYNEAIEMYNNKETK